MTTIEATTQTGQEANIPHATWRNPAEAVVFLRAVRPIISLLGNQMLMAESGYAAVQRANIDDQVALLTEDGPVARREAAAELGAAEHQLDAVRTAFDHKAQQIQMAQQTVNTQPQ